MTRLRVLICAFSCHPSGESGLGSGEDVLGWNMVRQVARCHDTWVLTYSQNEQSIIKAIHEAPLPNVHFHYIDLPSWLRSLLRIQGGHQFYYYLWQIKAYLVSRQLNRKLRFNLFHHLTYANDWMASFIGALLPVPYVRGPGGGAHKTPPGFGTEYTLGGRIWEGVRTLGQWALRRDPFFLKGQSRAQAIMVCNQESLSSLPKAWSQKAHMFPVSGITSEDLSHTPNESRNGSDFQVLSVGSLIRIKGFGLTIRAFELFARQHPQATLSIIGDGPEKNRLKSLVIKLGIESRVQFLSAMPRDSVMRHMAECDVFLFPSLRDGGGTVVIEAMAAGKAVICLDTGGPRMHITEECGVKVEPITPHAAVAELAEALNRMYLDDELRRRLGEAGQRRAAELYHWDRLGDRLMRIYEQATSTPAKSSHP